MINELIIGLIAAVSILGVVIGYAGVIGAILYGIDKARTLFKSDSVSPEEA